MLVEGEKLWCDVKSILGWKNPIYRDVMKKNGASKKHLLFLLYPSVFLGPFGGNTVLALIPSLERFFNADISFMAASIMVYMIPFATIASVSQYISFFC